MKTDRPVNLSISPYKFRFPLAALASITHRITGVVLFVGLGFALYALDMALSGADGFQRAGVLMQEPLSRLIMIGLLAALIYHVLAGIKHLLLDFHIGDTNEAAFAGSIAVIAGTVVVTAVLGGMLW